MGCFLVLNSYAGENTEIAAKKLSLMFRMAPQQAHSIIDQVTKGKVWRFQNEITDQQAAVAENYLKAMGFQVGRSGDQAAVNPLVEAATLEQTSAGVALKTAPSLTKNAQTSVPPQKGRTTAVAAQAGGGKPMYFGFHGSGGGLFKIQLVNWIFTMLTLGIYYFWGKTNERRYLWEQTSFTGDRFFYHGTGKELIKGAMIFYLFFIGLGLGVSLLEGILGKQMADIAGGIMVVGIWVLIPAILVGAYRYRLSRTAWRGIRFSFRGTRQTAIGLYVKGMLLTLITLSLYWPYFSVEKRKFWVGNTYFGNKGAEYNGDGKDIFSQFIIALLLVPLTFGVYWFWYQAFLSRYNWSKTKFAGGTFNFNATGGQLFSLGVVNLLLLIFTAGIAMPWVVVRNTKFVTEHLTVDANMQLSQVVQDAKQSSALSEGAADGMDIDMDFGI